MKNPCIRYDGYGRKKIKRFIMSRRCQHLFWST